MNRVVIITGSSRGIGKNIVNHFLDNGDTVIGFSRSEIKLDNANYQHYALDIANPQEVQQAFRKIMKKFNKLDILINNAGVASSQFSMLMLPIQVQEMLNTNLLGTFMISREAAKIMKKGNFGRIINISSMLTVTETEGSAIYSACKSGIETMANIMAKEFSSYNITCNSIGMTPVETDMLRSLSDEKVQEIVDTLIIKRLANFEDVFNIIDFFSSEKSSFITAQTIYLGGIH